MTDRFNDSLARWEDYVLKYLPTINLYVKGMNSDFDGGFYFNVYLGYSKSEKVRAQPFFGKHMLYSHFEDAVKTNSMSSHFMVEFIRILAFINDDYPKYDFTEYKNRYQYRKALERIFDRRNEHLQHRFSNTNLEIVKSNLLRFKIEFKKLISEMDTNEESAKAIRKCFAKDKKVQEKSALKFSAMKEEAINSVSKFISIYELQDKPEVIRFLLGTDHQELSSMMYHIKHDKNLCSYLDDERIEKGIIQSKIEDVLNT